MISDCKIVYCPLIQGECVSSCAFKTKEGCGLARIPQQLDQNNQLMSTLTKALAVSAKTKGRHEK